MSSVPRSKLDRDSDLTKSVKCWDDGNAFKASLKRTVWTLRTVILRVAVHSTCMTQLGDGNLIFFVVNHGRKLFTCTRSRYETSTRDISFVVYATMPRSPNQFMYHKMT